MKIIRWILCNCLGIHKWEYIYDNKVFPFAPYKYCKYCGKIKTDFD